MRPEVRRVFLAVPNVIGYARVALALAAFWCVSDARLFLPLYGLSCMLDAADGWAARRLCQCTLMGAVLDMVTDRSTTAGLLCVLCRMYPARGAVMALQVLLGLDLSSHYMHMYASLSSGAPSHKAIDARRSWLLRLYYTSRAVLFVACALNEAFFVALYALRQDALGAAWAWWTPAWTAVLVAAAPVFAFKQAMNVIQLCGAAVRLAEIDVARNWSASPKPEAGPRRK